MQQCRLIVYSGRSAAILLAMIASGGCRGWWAAESDSLGVEWKQETLLVHDEGPLSDSTQTLMTRLQGHQRTISRLLDLPRSDRLVDIYLFADEQRFEGYVRQKWGDVMPHRRAFFVAHESDLDVYALKTPQLETDLRHELTHAYLHAASVQLPLWLDEGLAEYLEVSPESQAIHAEHLQTLREFHAASRWQPNLLILEALSDASAMSQLHYAESWAWVHWLLADPHRKELLRTYVRGAYAGEIQRPFSELLLQSPHAMPMDLVAYLNQLSDGANSSLLGDFRSAR